MNPPLDLYLHGMQTGRRMVFASERMKPNEDMRRLSKMIYHLRIEDCARMGWMPSMMLHAMRIGGYVQQGRLTKKGCLLSHEMSKAAMEALPFPIQDPSSIDNLQDYQAYCRNPSSEAYV